MLYLPFYTMIIRLFVLFVLFFGGQRAAAQSCLFTLTGHVTDQDTREPLAGATVVLLELNRQLATDGAGDFVFDSVCAGRYTLEVSHISCSVMQRKIKIDRNRHTDLILPHARSTLSAIVVEAQKGTPNTGFKKELSGRRLDEVKGLSISEALSKINGVTMLQTGSAIAKPIIHGLHGNRLLTINNGVRQEGQQWGNEHAPEIDAFIADRLTIIKGVDELRYGSDAIGGVILVQPKPLQYKPGYAAEFNAGYFTNNRQYVASGVYEQQFRNLPAFAWRIQGTFKKGANAATPHYRLNNTGSEEYNFSATAGWRSEQFNTELFYSQFNTKVGIFIGSHIGNLSDLEKAIEADRPDAIFLGQNTYTIGRPYQDVTHHLAKSRSQFSINRHRFTLQLAGQFNNRKEFDIVRNSTIEQPQLNLTISTLSEDISWEHPAWKNWQGTVGIAAMQQDNAYAGRYFIPNYRSNTLGAYALEKWSRHKWELQAGLRYDNKNISTNRLVSGGSAFDNYYFQFSNFAASIHTAFKPVTNWKINAAISLSQRAPHVNELLSNGIHHGTATYEEGDIDLQSEKGVNLSLGLHWHNTANTVSTEIDLYHNRIDDFIYRQPVPDEPILTIAGAFPLIRYQQTDATLTGLDVSLITRPFQHIEWNSRVSILRARNRRIDDWLSQMPADRLSTEVLYNFKDSKRISGAYISLEWQHVFEQTRIPDETSNKQDYKAPPSSWSLLNGNASFTIGLTQQLPLTINIGARNLLNKVYRDYLNSMRYFADETGRNIYLRLKIPINNSQKQPSIKSGL
jgi:iron complex outermembrane recepter protein